MIVVASHTSAQLETTFYTFWCLCKATKSKPDKLTALLLFSSDARLSNDHNASYTCVQLKDNVLNSAVPLKHYEIQGSKLVSTYSVLKGLKFLRDTHEKKIKNRFREAYREVKHIITT